MSKKKNSRGTKVLKRESDNNGSIGNSRVIVSKTYKLYIGGAFVRSERGRVLRQMDSKGNFVANYSWATRKDFRDAAVKARKAQDGWSARSAFNRSQIIFRIAEMLEDRAEIFIEKLQKLVNFSRQRAEEEVFTAVDRIFWYAGWADKYAQVLSSVNPVAAPFFNFTVPEPTGVVAILAPKNSPFLGFVSSFLPVILSGNTAIVIVENDAPILALDFAEVLATSDVPPGVVNILTGKRDELLYHVASHMDINAIAYYGDSAEEIEKIQNEGAENIKRIAIFDDPPADEWLSERQQNLYFISKFTEWKTAWHPIGV